ncbi:NAC domain [Dillenia turbinata]|uniref:NAC domain n=1 Tax=Dillenia turbinata TaxID=194707 RepID=A0AAN8VN71_9MAGN
MKQEEEACCSSSPPTQLQEEGVIDSERRSYEVGRCNNNNNNNMNKLESLPPGYRFQPTEEELISQYLMKKANNEPLPPNKMILENIYTMNPDQLLEKYGHVWADEEGYFFTSRDRKYPNGQRPNRGTPGGYWKASGADTAITRGDIIGFKKALVYYEGKGPKAVKTNWIMQEYRLKQDVAPTGRPTGDMRLDDFVLCKIYKKLTDKSRKRAKHDHGDDEHAESSSTIEPYVSDDNAHDGPQMNQHFQNNLQLPPSQLSNANTSSQLGNNFAFPNFSPEVQPVSQGLFHHGQMEPSVADFSALPPYSMMCSGQEFPAVGPDNDFPYAPDHLLQFGSSYFLSDQFPPLEDIYHPEFEDDASDPNPP